MQPEDNAEQNKPQVKCYARRHMSMAASAYHSYAFAVSRTSGVFYSDDRRDAEDFGVSKTTILSLRSRLEKDGWFVRLDRGKKRKRNPVTGQYPAIRYKILSHDQWAAAHPGKCRYSPAPISGAGPAPISGAGEASSAPDSGFTCTSLPIPPAPDSGAKVVDSSLKEEQVNPSASKPAAPEGTVFPEWWPTQQWNEFLNYRKQRRAPVTPYAEQLAIKTLSRLRADGFDPAEVIERSILNHWLGFFPPKSNPGSRFNRTTEESRAQMIKNAKTLRLHPSGVQYVTSEFGPRKPRDPAVQAAIEAIARAHGFAPITLCSICSKPIPECVCRKN